MKLNCEGGELLILRDLIRSGKIHMLANVMIDFDIRKITSKKHEQANLLIELKAAGFTNYSLRKQVMRGTTHQKSIRFWLANLDNSADFMNLSTREKIFRAVPMWLRWRLQKKWRNWYFKFLRIIGRERNYY